MEFKTYLKEESNLAILGDFEDNGHVPAKMYSRPAVQVFGDRHQRPEDAATVIMKNDMMTRLVELEKRLAMLEKMVSRRAG